MKVLREEFLDDSEWRERFRREAEHAQTISSPYVVKMLHAGTSKSARRPWIAFELVSGESLDAYARRSGGPSFDDVQWMVSDLLQGLAAVHEAKIVHRDIKPANLQIDPGLRRLRIMDFGIAKRERIGSAQTSGLTRINRELGTPSFMSPEQMLNPARVDARSDLFSAGRVVFSLLAGRDALREAPTDAPVSLARATRTTWPEELQGWLNQMMAAEPSERFGSARAALNAWTAAVDALRAHVPTALPSDGYGPVSDSLRADTEPTPSSSR